MTISDPVNKLDPSVPLIFARYYDYIASPYSHPEPLVREERYLRASYYLMQCLRNCEWAYSPIVHCHELAKIWDLPKDAAFWEEYNFVMLRGAKRVKVLRLDGWEKSIGVRDERAEAERLGIPVILV